MKRWGPTVKNFKTAEHKTQSRALCDCMGPTPMKLALVLSPMSHQHSTNIQAQRRGIMGTKGRAVLCEIAGVCVDLEIRHGYHGVAYVWDGGRWADLKWAAGHMEKTSIPKNRIQDPD